MAFSCKITPEQSGKLKKILEERNWTFKEVPYANYRADGADVNIVSYCSGKLVIQGKNFEDFILSTLEPEILGKIVYQGGNQSETITTDNPYEFALHGGIDESGKGDFFGPLVIAGVVVTAKTAPLLRQAGACDSKQISSDQKIREIANKIREIAIGHYAVLRLKPETYNRLYEQIGNLNRLLAWGHARTMENLLELVPDCPRMLSDKFADEHFIRQALLPRARQIQVDQQVRAESDVAVAAASILARDAFVYTMNELSENIGSKLPLGAGPGVKLFAMELLKNKGAEIFRTCAKIHFKTYNEILN